MIQIKDRHIEELGICNNKFVILSYNDKLGYCMTELTINDIIQKYNLNTEEIKYIKRQYRGID